MKESAQQEWGRAAPRDRDRGPLGGEDSRCMQGWAEQGRTQPGQSDPGDPSVWLPGAVPHPALPADPAHGPWLRERWLTHCRPHAGPFHTRDAPSLARTRTHKGTQQARAHRHAHACSRATCPHTHGGAARAGAHVHVHTLAHTCPRADTPGPPAHSTLGPAVLPPLGDVCPGHPPPTPDRKQVPTPAPPP